MEKRQEVPVADIKTKPTHASVDAFVKKVPDAKKRADTMAVIELMREATKTEPKMWGPSIIGFGSYHYKYDSGREGDMPFIGLSPRKQSLVLYIVPGFEDYKADLKKLGPHSTGKSCLYIKRLRRHTDVEDDRREIDRQDEEAEIVVPLRAYRTRLASTQRHMSRMLAQWSAVV